MRCICSEYYIFYLFHTIVEKYFHNFALKQNTDSYV